MGYGFGTLANYLGNSAKAAVNTVVDVVEAVTGETQQKKNEAKKQQKQANKERDQAKAQAESAHRQLAESKADATVAQRTNMNQNSSSNRQLAQRAMATARAATFETQELNKFALAITDDLKALAESSASTEALKETNVRIGEITTSMGAVLDAYGTHLGAQDKAIEALNEENERTSNALLVLTEAMGSGGQKWGQVGGKLLPILRTAISALNREAPTNKIAYWAYVGSDMFLGQMFDEQTKEIIQTALQIFAYWDEDGLTGLLETRPDVLPSVHQTSVSAVNALTLQNQLSQAHIDAAMAWFADPVIMQELVSLGLLPPTIFAGGYPAVPPTGPVVP